MRGAKADSIIPGQVMTSVTRVAQAGSCALLPASLLWQEASG
jgi:hypothetical protein